MENLYNKQKEYNDAVKKTVQEMESNEVNKTEVNKTEVNKENSVLITSEKKDLGKVSDFSPSNKITEHVSHEEEKEIIKRRQKYIDLKMENLPSQGRFYPYGTKISIRPAEVKEIRDFSTIEEEYMLDVNDKLNNMLIACTYVDIPGKMGSYKDILEEDRFYIILSIRELTFVDGESQLIQSHVCTQCETENKIKIKTINLDFNSLEENLLKYYNPETAVFEIKTKSLGEFTMAPPNVGVMKVITDFIKEKQEKNQKWDKDFLQILPYIQTDWRNFNKKILFDKLVEFQGWSKEKFLLVYNLADKMKIGVKKELTHFCEKCGSEMKVPLSFPGGLKSLFVPTNVMDELI